MGQTPVPKPRALVSVPRPESLRRPFDTRAHAARYVEARRQRRLGGAKLPVQIFQPNEVLIDFGEDMETGFVIMIGHADVFICVTEKDTAGREVEALRETPIYELTEGDVINAELFSHDGMASGGISEVRVVARTEITAVLVSPYDLADDKVHPIQRQLRTDFVFDTLSRALEKSEAMRRFYRLEEEQFDAAIDAEREKRSTAEAQKYAAERHSAELELAKAALEAKIAELEQRNLDLLNKKGELEKSLEEQMNEDFWREVTDANLEEGISWLPPGPDPTKKPPHGS